MTKLKFLYSFLYLQPWRTVIDELWILLVVAIPVVGFFWAVIKLFAFSFGKYNNYIEVPLLAWLSLVLGIWIPILSLIVLAYIFFWCKSPSTLMRMRAEAITNLTPEDIVESVDNHIIQNDLISDEWVIDTWNNSSKSKWIERISSNRSFLEQALDSNMTIHATKGVPLVHWTDVIKHYLHHEKNSEVNAIE